MLYYSFQRFVPPAYHAYYTQLEDDSSVRTSSRSWRYE